MTLDMWKEIARRVRPAIILQRPIQRPPGYIDLRDELWLRERALLEWAMVEASGVQAEAARRLGITRGDIGYKLRKHGLPLKAG